MEYLYTKNGREYYRNADGKTVSQPCDSFRNYRRDELAPEVNELLDRSRDERHYYPSKGIIDSLCDMQNCCVSKAVNYAKYRLFGECTYQEVFGTAAEDRYKAEKHYSATDEMKNTLENMAAQMKEMQKLMFNMATQMNQTNKSNVNYIKRVG